MNHLKLKVVCFYMPETDAQQTKLSEVLMMIQEFPLKFKERQIY